MVKGKKQNQPVSSWPRLMPWLLFIIAFLVYVKAAGLGFTKLDDDILLNDRYPFFSSIKNLGKFFTSSVFEDKGFFYRPVLSIYFLLVFPFTSPESIVAFHIGNMIVHGLTVVLLFFFLQNFIPEKNHVFILSLLFALHPAFTMAVAWIPGINDLLLTAFALCYFISLLNAVEQQVRRWVVINLVFLFLALFTKETAAFLPLGGVLLLWHQGHLNKINKSWTLPILGTVLCWLIWFLARKNVLPPNTPALINGEMLALIPLRILGFIQYFGKCILPFNLTVCPFLMDTSNIFGMIGIALVFILIIRNTHRKIKTILLGLAWFLLFLLPIFFVPVHENNHLYEHRLYLPMIGILFLLSQTVLFSSKVSATTGTFILLAYSLASLVMINKYISDFQDGFSFWSKAAADSPHSAYANKIWGLTLAENNQSEEALLYIRKAYALDSTTKFLNLYLSRLNYAPRKQWDSASYFLKKEIRLNPQFPDTYFDLAVACHASGNLEGAEENFKIYLTMKPDDQGALTNLFLIYNKQKKFKHSVQMLETLNKHSIPVDSTLILQIRDSAKTSKD